MAAFYWIDRHARQGHISCTALKGGVDIDGQDIYVGRAQFENNWLPAKIIPGRNVAYVSYNGVEYAMEEYQLLCEQRFDWVRSRKGEVPPDAVIGGRTKDGETLYIGRAEHKRSQTVGKIHPSHKCCYIPFGGKEIKYKDYEVLVLRH